MSFEETPFEDFSIDELSIEELESCLKTASSEIESAVVIDATDPIIC